MPIAHRLCVSLATLGLAFVTSGCDRMSFAELREGLLESVLQGQAQVMTHDVVELTTSFTIGQGLTEIRAEIRAFAESQSPCSTVTLEGETRLIIDFGELGDACTYRGRTYAGVVTIDLELAAASDPDPDQVIVHHQYAALRNEQLQLDGEVDVTWAGGARQVVSDLEFEHEAEDGETRSLAVQAERTISVADPDQGFAGGLQIDGWRDWQGERGDWHLDIEAVEFRATDPIPESGSYVLTTPEDQVITMTFERIDEDTIAATIIGPRRERVFEVTAAGEVGE